MRPAHSVNVPDRFSPRRRASSRHTYRCTVQKMKLLCSHSMTFWHSGVYAEETTTKKASKSTRTTRATLLFAATQLLSLFLFSPVLTPRGGWGGHVSEEIKIWSVVRSHCGITVTRLTKWLYLVEPWRLTRFFLTLSPSPPRLYRAPIFHFFSYFFYS